MSLVDLPEQQAAAKTVRRLNLARALSEGLAQAMQADPSVIALGEDVAKLGGVWGTMQGLLDKFGPVRVRDTPISEAGFIGAAVGMAATGLRPVVELMFVDFVGVCMNSIYSLAAKQSFFSGGQVTCPMVLMTAVGGGYSDAGQHSQCLYSTFGHMPGLKVVMPSTAHDAKGMILSAVRDDNPVIFMFHKALLGTGFLGIVPGSITHVPEEIYYVPLDKAAVVWEGTDITLVGLGLTTHHALDAAKSLAAQGISAEVIDLRSIAPIDHETIRTSVRKTGRLIAIDDDYQSYGVSGEVIAVACEDSRVRMRSAPRRLAFPNTSIPFSPGLEHALLPNAEKVTALALATIAEDYR